MKRLLFAFVIFVALAAPAFAEDCMHDPIYERNWNAEVTTGMRVRNIPCMQSSTVLTTVPVGQVVKVIAETDGYYKVRLKDGTEGWSGQWLMRATNKPFNQDIQKEPLYDVSGHTYETAVRYLGNKGIIGGYSDGSYKPNKSVNRAEFTKIIVGAKLGGEPTSYTGNCFPDVRNGDWFTPYVCYAKNAGIIDGYQDGTFKPSNTINLAEATKILVNTLNISKPATSTNPWYRPYMEAMQNNSYIPSTFKVVNQLVNRGEMAEMTWRILEKNSTQPFTQFQFADAPSASQSSGSSDLSCVDDKLPSNINFQTVRDTWMGWYNAARKQEGLSNYTYNPHLHYSATVWSEYMKSQNKMSHNRPGQTDYYDYTIITKWFSDLGFMFKNSNGVTYSENIGYGTYRCNTSDCTQSFINAIRPIFDAYMNEKGTPYTGHYDSVMNAYFKEIGLGFAVDSAKEVMYLTVHYGTELSKVPSGVCD